MGERAAGDRQRVSERERVGIAGPRHRAQRGLVHQGTERKVSEEKPPRFLPHQLGRLAAEDAVRSPEVGFEFVKRRLDLPAFVVERCQFLSTRTRRSIPPGSPMKDDKMVTFQESDLTY